MKYLHDDQTPEQRDASQRWVAACRVLRSAREAHAVEDTISTLVALLDAEEVEKLAWLAFDSVVSDRGDV